MNTRRPHTTQDSSQGVLFEHLSDWFTQRVVHRMWFTADVPKPNAEAFFGLWFGLFLLFIVFLSFVVAAKSRMSLLEGLRLDL